MKATASKETARVETAEYRGGVLEVLQHLLTQGQNEAVIELVSKLVSENDRLQKQLSELLVGRRKGEAVSSEQLKLFLDELAEEDDEELAKASEELKESAGLDELGEKKQKRKKPKQPKGRQPAPADLRRIDNLIPVPSEDRACPECGAERVCIGHDVTEVIELIPAEVVVRVDRREKLACKDCEGELVRAPTGDKIVESGKFGCRFVSNLVVDKYRDGLPLNRQRQRLERLGLSVSNSTLSDQIGWAMELLRPLWRAAIALVLGAGVMQLDGTSIAVWHQEKNGKRRLKLGSLWGYLGDGQTALYLYTSTGKKVGQRPGELGPEEMLRMREGYTVADASNLFDKSFKNEELIECGCNMHARRYFKKALDAGDTRAALPVGAFKRMYDIEEESKELSNEERLQVRQEQIKPIYDSLIEWSQKHQPHEPPATPMAKALRYLLNHQLALRRFLNHGAIPMDNGAVERLHIRVALTRKNYLFAGSHTGGERAAIAYTILASCALVDVNPEKYLADVLPKLARGIRLRDAPDLLPAKWKESRSISQESDQNS